MMGLRFKPARFAEHMLQLVPLRQHPITTRRGTVRRRPADNTANVTRGGKHAYFAASLNLPRIIVASSVVVQFEDLFSSYVGAALRRWCLLCSALASTILS